MRGSYYLLMLAVGLSAQTAMAAQAESDIPKAFAAKTGSFDYQTRSVDIPMRDGKKLRTILLIPKGVSNAPIILGRTPYDASSRIEDGTSAHGQIVIGSAGATFFRAGYILAYQDIRGKHGSQGVYVNERPLRGPLNSTSTDHSTDAWDTIDWLVKNVKETNGRVGMIGTSYDGMMVAMALVGPHPALKAAVPANPVINTWLGDDDFHGGAFRQVNYDYYFTQHGAKGDAGPLWRDAYDDYDNFLKAGNATGFVKKHGLDQLPFVRRLRDHPAYDDFWKEQALETILARQPQVVPTLWVAGVWDQEDIYGAVAAWKAVRKNDPQGVNHLVIGPWNHGGWSGDGSSLGPIRFDSDTALWFRKSVLMPFLDAHLKSDAPPVDLPPVLAFQTGANEWQRLQSWPLSCADGCLQASKPLFLQSGGALGLTPSREEGFDEYVSDPAKPVPYRLRPIRPGPAEGSTWDEWLVDDQRPFSDRPDVLVYKTEPLTSPVAISGTPIANLVASTSGTDGDFVVKLIDVYPDEYAPARAMSGYQLAVSMDIFRGRYRKSLSAPEPIEAGTPSEYRFALPDTNHVFLPGHRIMVQIQSSWFPLYDRNPQSFVPNIFDAPSGAYRKAMIRIFRDPKLASYIELPIVEP